MKSDYNHIIQKYIFELDVKAPVSSLDWEIKAHQYTQEILIPGLEKSFKEVENEDRHYVIDKLTLDLGIFQPDEFENEAIKRLEPLVQKYLRNLGNNNSKEDISVQTVKPGDAMDLDSRPKIEQENTKEVSSANARYLVFLNFLNLGRFPWWYDDRLKHLNMEDQFTISWVDALGEDKKESLREILQSVHRARIRLANNFGIDWKGDFFEAIGMNGKLAVTHWQMLFPLLKTYFENEIIFQQHFWNSWIESYGQINKQLYFEKLINVISDNKGKKTGILKDELLLSSKQNLKNKTLSKESRFLLANLKGSISGSGESSANKKTPDLKRNKKEDTKSHIPNDKNNLQDISDENAGKEFSGNKTEFKNLSIQDKKVDPFSDTLFQNDEDVLYVEAAGLVLLHPFLEELFHKRDLWAEGQWQSDVAVHYAVQLMAFLAYGEEPVTEHQLLMNKILAGMELETLFRVDIILQEQDKKACINLLEAVIDHWKALRNTSTQGLQVNFLQREGKIEIKNDQYILDIENRTEDILLSHIPWGYGIIKLPWMQHRLHVNWV